MKTRINAAVVLLPFLLVIYLINSDETFRNLLQYGEETVNYLKKNGIVVPYTTGENVYSMQLEYTGTVFNAYYCVTEGWTKWDENSRINGEAQNAESVLAEVELPAEPENSGSSDGASNS